MIQMQYGIIRLQLIYLFSLGGFIDLLNIFIFNNFVELCDVIVVAFILTCLMLDFHSPITPRQPVWFYDLGIYHQSRWYY